MVRAGAMDRSGRGGVVHENSLHARRGHRPNRGRTEAPSGRCPTAHSREESSRFTL